ncbi:MAG: hypothetical protein O7C67_07810 [Gammaproteobacteria bacterium]|nr:hypothetical protein [Gammaproteobacteria bacterium]
MAVSSEPGLFIVKAGRLRRLESFAYVLAAFFGGWIWFGNTGAALLGMWACVGWPRSVIALQLPDHPTRVKLGRFAITWSEGFGGFQNRQRLFRDEASLEEYARLRREFMRSVSA